MSRGPPGSAGAAQTGPLAPREPPGAPPLHVLGGTVAWECYGRLDGIAGRLTGAPGCQMDILGEDVYATVTKEANKAALFRNEMKNVQKRYPQIFQNSSHESVPMGRPVHEKHY